MNINIKQLKELLERMYAKGPSSSGYVSILISNDDTDALRDIIKFLEKKELQKSLEYFVKEHNKLIDIIYDLNHELNNKRNLKRR